MHVVSQLEVGGLEKLLVHFARLVNREEVSPTFVCLQGRGRVGDEIAEQGWPVEFLDGSPGLRPGLVWRLSQLMRRQRVDVVHTHNAKPLLYAGPAAKLSGVKGVVHTRHGQQFGATPRKTFAFRLASRLVDRMVCVSADSAVLSREEGVEADRIRVVVNGVDPCQFRFMGSTACGPAVMVGRLSPEKGVDVLVRAVAHVVSKQPAFQLRIAGEGACGNDLRALASKLSLAGRHVQFLGEVRDVPRVLAGASMFVLPSRTEGISLTLLEAMARGLPVIATRVGGTPEVVTAANGLLVEPDDPEGLAKAILALWDDPARCSAMGLSGRRRVENEFDVRHAVARYESLYREVIQPSSRSPRAATRSAQVAS